MLTLGNDLRHLGKTDLYCISTNQQNIQTMAKFNNGTLGLLHGTVGGRVYYVTNGKQRVRTLGEVHNPRTTAQQRGRSAFGTLSHMAARMKYELRTGLALEAHLRDTTAYHLFLSLNREAAGSDGVDYGALQVACGPLATASYGQPVLTAPLRVEVTVTTSAPSAHGSIVFLLAYAPAMEESHLSGPQPLSSGVAVVELPHDFAGQAVHLYAFSGHPDGRVSPSTWVGFLSMPAPEA